MTLSDRNIYVVVTVCSFVGFLISFFVAWIASATIWKRHWARFPLFEKADWVSRCNSTLHAIIIVPGFIATLASTNWDSDYFERSNPLSIRIFMCISIAYFCFDFLVIIYYRVPLWIVFVVHHIVASVPFFIHLFHPCPSGTFALAMFLLVEIATLFLNFQVWLEKTGHAKETRYTVMFYITYVSWLITRVALPIFVVTIMYKNIYFNDKARDDRSCMIPAMVCGHIIVLFCLSVFFFVLTPDLVRRWRETPEDVEKRIKEIRLKRKRSGGGASLHDGSRRGSRGSATATPAPPADGENVDAVEFGAMVHTEADFSTRDNTSVFVPPAQPADGTGPREAAEPPPPASTRRVQITEPATTAAVGTEPVGGSDASSSDDDDADSDISLDDIVNVVMNDNPISERPAERPLAEDVEMRGLSVQEGSALYLTTSLHL